MLSDEAMRRFALMFWLLGACSGFKPVGGPRLQVGGPGESDGGGPNGSDGGTGLATDGAIAAADYACAGLKSYWANPAREGECTARQVFPVEATVFDPRTLAIARSAGGHLGIVYRAEQNADQADLHAAHFDIPKQPADFPSPVPISAQMAQNIGERVGVVSAIAGGSDRLHVAYLTDADWSKEIFYQELTKDGLASAPLESVATGQASSGEIAIAVAPTGDVHLAHFNPATGMILHHVRAAGTWRPAVTVQSNLDDQPGTGQLQLVMDPNLPRVVYHRHNSTFLLSAPQYREFDGTAWSDPMTLDDNTLGGFSPSLALFGNQKWAAYFIAVDDHSSRLKLASWDGSGALPEHVVLEDAIPVGKANPIYRAKLAVDGFGLLHMVAFIPDQANGGRIEYRRQTDGQGQRGWLTDVVDYLDGNGQSEPLFGLVDLDVEPSGRPHIVYYGSKDLTVRYATRFDR